MSLSYADGMIQEPSGLRHDPSEDSGLTRHPEGRLWTVYRGSIEESVVCTPRLRQISEHLSKILPPSDDQLDDPEFALTQNIFSHKIALGRLQPIEPNGPEGVQLSRKAYVQWLRNLLPRLAGIVRSCIPMKWLLWKFNRGFRQVWKFDSGTILPGLMVIDCFSEHVVTADPDCEYIALSYVWGAGDDGGKHIFDPDLRGRRLPQTVQDAMNVVRVLGTRFLWVDRYCINSSEPATKHYMISNMDTIYARAYLTIIAAAGDSDKYGLPNVRHPSYGIKIPPWNGIAFRDTPGLQQDYFKESTWSTRGWTYQEGLLSQRQLVFTDAGVIFRKNTSNGVCTSSGIFTHINEYSRRKLTYPSDSLNALLGVFRAYERLRPPAMHVWGVPFCLASSGFSFFPGPGVNPRHPGYGLLWKASTLCFLQRIDGIPSWTWAGWSGWTTIPAFGPYDWLLRKAPLNGPEVWEASDIAIEVLVGDQRQTILEHFYLKRRLSSHQSEDPAPVLFLTAWSTTLRFSVSQVGIIHFADEDVGPGDFTLDETPGVLSESETQPNEQWSCEWTAAIICWRLCNDTADNMRGLRTQSLLLERVGENTFRRIGILGTNWRKSDIDEKGRIAASGRAFTRKCLRIE